MARGPRGHDVMEHILLKLPLDGSLPTFLSDLSSSSKQQLHTRRQPFRILVFARRSHIFCFQLCKSILALNSSIAGRVFIGISSRRQSTLGAPPSRLQLSPPTSYSWPSNQGTQHSCDDIHLFLLLSRSSPSALGSQKLLINNLEHSQIWTPLPRARPTRLPGVVRRWPAQTSPRMEPVWECSSISSHRISIDLRIGVITLDPWLSPFKDSLKRRYSKAQDWIKTIQDTEGGLDKFSKVWLVGWDSLTSHGADPHIRGPTPWDCT